MATHRLRPAANSRHAKLLSVRALMCRTPRWLLRHMLRCCCRKAVDARLGLLLHVLRRMLLIPGMLLRRGRSDLARLRSWRALLSGVHRMLQVTLLRMRGWLAHGRW